MNTKLALVIAASLLAGCADSKWKVYEAPKLPSGEVECKKAVGDEKLGQKVWEVFVSKDRKGIPPSVIELAWTGTKGCDAYLRIDGEAKDPATKTNETEKQEKITSKDEIAVACRKIDEGTGHCKWRIISLTSIPAEAKVSSPNALDGKPKQPACGTEGDVWSSKDADMKGRVCNVAVQWKASKNCEAILNVTYGDGTVRAFSAAKDGPPRFATFIEVQKITLKCDGTAKEANEGCEAAVIRVERPPK